MSITSSIPEIKKYQYSMDWRFYLPMHAESKILYIGENREEVASFFNLIKYNSVSTLSAESVFQEPVLTHLLSKFDIVAAPYAASSADDFFVNGIQQVETYKTLRKLLSKQGILLFGFTNKRFFRKENGLAPQRVKALLKKAGFQTIKLYATLPDSFSPEYIFPLETPEMNFAIRYRYRHRFAPMILKLLTSNIPVNIFSNFFSAYFVIAKVD